MNECINEKKMKGLCQRLGMNGLGIATASGYFW